MKVKVFRLVVGKSSGQHFALSLIVLTEPQIQQRASAEYAALKCPRFLFACPSWMSFSDATWSLAKRFMCCRYRLTLGAATYAAFAFS